MMKRLARLVIAALVMIGASGCFFTDPKPLLDEFTWEPEPDQSLITEGVEIAPFFADISFLGQLKTPTMCYNVAAELEVDGRTLTVRVNGTPANNPTCAQVAGGIRYIGAIRNLSSGTYTVKVIQTFTNVGTQEFTKEVNL